VGLDSTIDVTHLPCTFFCKTSYFSFVEWEPQQPYTWDCYPVGSFFLADLFIESVFSGQHEETILYLSRGNHGSRYIINEGELLEAFAQEPSIGTRLKIFEFRKNISSSEQEKMFNSAAIVVGMHGGAFSNIIFCRQSAVILEINQANGRDCFAAICLSRGLKYERFVPQGWPGYTGGGFILSNKNIHSLTDLIKSYAR
jgi:hypothetical protein